MSHNRILYNLSSASRARDSNHPSLPTAAVPICSWQIRATDTAQHVIVINEQPNTPLIDIDLPAAKRFLRHKPAMMHTNLTIIACFHDSFTHSPGIYSRVVQYVTALHRAHAGPSLQEIPPTDSRHTEFQNFLNSPNS